MVFLFNGSSGLWDFVDQISESTGALLLHFADEDARSNWQVRFSLTIYRASVSYSALFSMSS